MDLPLVIYRFVAAGIAGLLLLRRFWAPLIKYVFNPRLGHIFFKHLALPYLFRRRRLWGPLTRLDAILYTVYLGGTFTCNILGVSNFAEASLRAGSLAVLHLLPVVFVPQLSIAAEIFGLSLSTYRRLHRVLGFMSIVQSALHVVFALQNWAFDLANKFHRYGLMVSFLIRARG